MKVFILLLLSLFLTVSSIKPNLLFVIVDDLNDWIEPYHSEPFAKTPFFKEFALNATIFENYHASYPRCNEARQALWFGKDPHVTGSWFDHGGQFNDLKKTHPEWLTLQETLRDGGYWVGGIGKVFHGLRYQSMEWDYYPFPNDTDPIFYPKSFDLSNYDYNTYTKIKYFNSAWMNNEHHWVRKMVKPVLNGNIDTGGKPWALFVGFARPHTPYFVPVEYISNNLPDVISDNFNQNDIGDLPLIAQNAIKTDGFFQRYERVRRNDPFGWQLTIQGYKACVSFIDQMFNNTIKILNEGPYSDSTIVMVT